MTFRGGATLWRRLRGGCLDELGGQCLALARGAVRAENGCRRERAVEHEQELVAQPLGIPGPGVGG